MKNRFKKVFLYVLFLLPILTLILGLSTRITVRKNSRYYDAEHVSLYILTYDGELPKNFITKQEAKDKYPELYYKKAWYRSIEEGYNIGGNIHSTTRQDGESRIGEYTDKKNLKECDIYPNGNQSIVKKENRGACRLVYAVDGSEVYYTDDHYQTFVRYTKWNINAFSNICLIICAVGVGANVFFVVAVHKKQRYDLKRDYKQSISNIGIFILAVVFVPIYCLYYLIKKAVVGIKKLCEGKR